MKSLASVTPTPEQLKIVRRVRPGTEIIRGAAGSGKTTTAALKLKLLLIWALSRRTREESTEPVRALVLTFNKTLRGYIKDVILKNVPEGNIEVSVETFAKWAMLQVGTQKICDEEVIKHFASALSAETGLPSDFLADEAVYVLGRFLPDDISAYLNCRRDGRGSIPRVERALREAILERVITPYAEWKNRSGLIDWNDLAVSVVNSPNSQYDIIIVDEAQDFSANQLRAVLAHRHSEAATSFVLDTAQRIYSSGFTWAEIGLSIRPEDSYRLSTNYRNTPEIARLAASLIKYVPLDDDGTAPLETDPTGNQKPLIIKGLYSKQVEWCINYIRSNVDLKTESVGFLNPGNWFAYLSQRLEAAGLEYILITKKSEWQETDINIALSTLHSAKGLDFDHCILIGLSRENLSDGEYPPGDERFDNACRLLSMAIGRARKQVILGYKPGEEPAIVHKLDGDCFDEVNL